MPWHFRQSSKPPTTTLMFGLWEPPALPGQPGQKVQLAPTRAPALQHSAWLVALAVTEPSWEITLQPTTISPVSGIKPLILYRCAGRFTGQLGPAFPKDTTTPLCQNLFQAAVDLTNRCD